MKVMHLSEAKPYFPPKHFNMTAIKLQGKEETGVTKFWVGLSYFLPGGGAEWAYEDNPLEKVYVVLDGEVTIKTKNEEVTLKPMDSVYLQPFEGRELVNKANKPATMLVIVNNP